MKPGCRAHHEARARQPTLAAHVDGVEGYLADPRAAEGDGAGRTHPTILALMGAGGGPNLEHQRLLPSPGRTISGIPYDIRRR